PTCGVRKIRVALQSEPGASPGKGQLVVRLREEQRRIANGRLIMLLNAGGWQHAAIDCEFIQPAIEPVFGFHPRADVGGGKSYRNGGATIVREYGAAIDVRDGLKRGAVVRGRQMRPGVAREEP